MSQPQYDYQANGEQIRHAQYDAAAAFERKQDEASDSAFIALAGMDGSELLQLCNDDPALDCRLVLLMERVALMGVAGSQIEAYKADVLRAAEDLRAAMVGLVAEKRVKAVRS